MAFITKATVTKAVGTTSCYECNAKIRKGQRCAVCDVQYGLDETKKTYINVLHIECALRQALFQATTALLTHINDAKYVLASVHGAQLLESAIREAR